MKWLDFTGACLSLTCTYYFTTIKRAAWIIGAIAIILNSALYYIKGIYGALFLESLYFISMMWGWYTWGRNKNNQIRPISLLKMHHGFILTFSSIIAIFLMSQFLILYTDSDIPYIDSTITVLSLVAQGLLCFKVIHCWILWFIVDVLVAGLHYYKGIPFHSAVHCVYLIFAVLGFYRWYKVYQQQQNSMRSVPVVEHFI